MARLVPAIHVFVDTEKTWIPGTRPGMTQHSMDAQGAIDDTE
jgi:hypothetical protein